MNNDLISRKYIQEQIPELDSYDNGCYVWLKREDVDNLINNAPAISFIAEVTPEKIIFTTEISETQKGEWVPDAGGYQCNKCFDHALEINGIEIRSNFCPNCGADMRGKDDE